MTPDGMILIGETCALIPYARGHSPRGLLYDAWRVMESEKAAPLVFHNYMDNEALPVSTRGDLVHFVEYFSQPTRPLLLVASLEDQAIAGMFWFDDIRPKYRASISVFFARAYFRKVATEAGHLAVSCAFREYEIKTLWAFTPWSNAAAYAKRIGFTPVTSLEGMAEIKGNPTDMQVLRLTAEEYLHGR